jgi:methylmalonyl-CoA mutase
MAITSRSQVAIQGKADIAHAASAGMTPKPLALGHQPCHFQSMTQKPDPLPLAAEFAAATQQQWRELVEGVLKGARFEDKLQSRSADGLVIEPLYPRAAGTTLVGGRAPGKPWQVMQRIDHPDPAACNAEALHELDNGATGLALIPAGAVGAYGYGFAPAADAAERILAGIHLDAGISIALEFSPYALDLPLEVARLVERRNVAPGAADIRFGLDPVGALALHGRLPFAWPDFAPRMARMVADLAGLGFAGPFATADGRVVHAAGGTEAQELAFALAAAVAYLRALEAGGMALPDARRAIAFRLTADADQFLTIAKFRALRLLWRRIEQSCGLTPAPAFVGAETAWRSLTRADAYANILRATIAVFAAGAGGADAIAVLPLTQARGLPDRFARRVARNTALVLLEEAGIARVADPTAGAGWSEDLTGKLCQAAWALFQEIEQAGGAVAALERGLIQAKIAPARAERERALQGRTDILVGANAFADSLPANVPVLAVPPPPLPDLPAAVAVAPLTPVRLAAPFEDP